jgi:hypothetical protein
MIRGILAAPIFLPFPGQPACEFHRKRFLTHHPSGNSRNQSQPGTQKQKKKITNLLPLGKVLSMPEIPACTPEQQKER